MGVEKSAKGFFLLFLGGIMGRRGKSVTKSFKKRKARYCYIICRETEKCGRKRKNIFFRLKRESKNE